MNPTAVVIQSTGQGCSLHFFVSWAGLFTAPRSIGQRSIISTMWVSVEGLKLKWSNGEKSKRFSEEMTRNATYDMDISEESLQVSESQTLMFVFHEDDIF